MRKSRSSSPSLAGTVGRVAGGILAQIVVTDVAALRPGTSPPSARRRASLDTRRVEDRLVGDLLQPERLAAR